MSRFTRFALVLCTIVLTAFGARTAVAVEATSQSMDEQMARLLPEGTAILVYTPSMSKLTTELTDIVKQIDQQAAGMLMFMGPQSLLSMQLNTKQKLRADMPAAIAIVPGTTIDADPAIVVIFAVNGATAENVKANDKSMKLVFLEGTDWVAMTSGATYEPRAAGSKAPTVATNLLPGMLSIAIDQAMCRTKYGDAMSKQLASMLDMGNDGKDPAQKRIRAINNEFASKLANGFDRWDVGTSFNPDTPGWTIQYTPSSTDWLIQPSEDLTGLGNHLVTDLPMQMVLSKDVILDALSIGRMFISSEGEAMEASLSKFMDIGASFMDQVSGGVGMSMGMSDTGMDVVKVMRVKDVSKALSVVDDQMKFLNEAKWGISSEAIPVTVGAETSRAYRIKFDEEQMKKAFPAEFAKSTGQSFAGGLMQADAHFGAMLSAMQGPDGLIIRFISKDDWMAIVVGDAKLLGTARRAITRAGSANAGLDQALKYSGGAPVMGMSMDVRSLFRGMGSFLGSHPALSTTPLAEGPNAIMAKLPSSPPAMVYGSASTSDGATRFTMRLDLKGIAAFNKDMLALTAEQEKQAEAARKAAEAKKDDKDDKDGKSGKP